MEEDQVRPSVGHPLREVARRTGLSLPTIRRYVRSGRILATLEPGPFGRQWEVSEEELLRFGSDLSCRGAKADATRIDHGSSQPVDPPVHPSRRMVDQQVRQPDQPSRDDQAGPRDSLPQENLPEGDPNLICRLREEVAYWRGRWEELRGVLAHLSHSMESCRTAGLEEDEIESSKEALRRRSQELAQARNLVDRLRAEKARLEEEVQALRERVRSAEPTLSDGVSVPARMRLEERRR